MKFALFVLRYLRKGKIWLIFLTILQNSAIIKLLNKFHRRILGKFPQRTLSIFVVIGSNMGYDAAPPMTTGFFSYFVVIC